MRSYECVWELPTGVICGLPEWPHDGRKILHPYCAPEEKAAADRRAARIADVAAIVTAWRADDRERQIRVCNVYYDLWNDETVREFAARYVARESEERKVD